MDRIAAVVESAPVQHHWFDVVDGIHREILRVDISDSDAALLARLPTGGRFWVRPVAHPAALIFDGH